MAAGYRDINTAKVVGTLQKWPAKAGGRSPKGPAVAGTTIKVSQGEYICIGLVIVEDTAGTFQAEYQCNTK